MKVLMSLLLTVVFTVVAFAQTEEKQIARRYVEVPREIVLQVVANQPESPLKFENLRYFADLNGGATNSYDVRNIGTKPIVSATVYSSNGTERTYQLSDSGKIVMQPGESSANRDAKSNIKEEIVPFSSLSPEMRAKLNLTNKMRSLVVLMVVEVIYADGTKFSDEAAKKELEEYIEKLTSALEDSQRRNKN